MPFLIFCGDHLRSSSGIICGSGSFAAQFGDHFWSGDHLRSGIICGAVQVIKSRRRQHLRRSYKHKAFQKEKHKLDLIQRPYLDVIHSR